jgi:hypothetical protein
MRFISFCFIAIFMCISCSKKEAQFVAPQDISSVEEKSILNATIAELESMFLEIGQPVSLSRIPIIITDTMPSTTSGRCIIDSDSSIILINKNLFDEYDKNLITINALWTVLAHEVGHCYFGRAHTEKDISAPNSKSFRNIYNVFTASGYFCFPNYRDTWSGTLMYEGYRIFVVPNSLKKFYIEELVGRIIVPTADDILKSPDVQLVDMSVVPSNGEPIPPVACE